MPSAPNRIARISVAATALVLGGLSLSACATRSYVDEQIANVNTRISAVDAKATEAGQKADAANAAAQAAATDARNANQRIDQITTRVDTLEQNATAAPRRARH
jgi:outer membrane murein-binding lipoprotein Lpp